MAGCAFKLPGVSLPGLSLALPSVPSIPSFAVRVPGVKLNLKLPGLALPSLSLSLPSVPSIPSFNLRCPLE
jgi:hypothetical protein